MDISETPDAPDMAAVRPKVPTRQIEIQKLAFEACYRINEITPATMASRVIMVLLWGQDSIKAMLNAVTVSFEWPALHNLVERMEPLVAEASPYPAKYTLNWLSAAGSACMIACILSVFVLRMSLAQAWEAFSSLCTLFP